MRAQNSVCLMHGPRRPAVGDVQRPRRGGGGPRRAGGSAPMRLDGEHRAVAAPTRPRPTASPVDARRRLPATPRPPLDQLDGDRGRGPAGRSASSTAVASWSQFANVGSSSSSISRDPLGEEPVHVAHVAGVLQRRPHVGRRALGDVGPASTSRQAARVVADAARRAPRGRAAAASKPHSGHALLEHPGPVLGVGLDRRDLAGVRSHATSLPDLRDSARGEDRHPQRHRRRPRRRRRDLRARGPARDRDVRRGGPGTGVLGRQAGRSVAGGRGGGQRGRLRVRLDIPPAAGVRPHP